MKKKFIFFILLLTISFFYVEDTYAYSKADYANRTLCGNFEVGLFKADGTIEAKSCHATFEEAKAAMLADGNPDLALLAKLGTEIKILDANAALVDFTHTTSTFNIYPTSQITKDTEHTYMTGDAAYGGGDGVLINSGYSTTSNTFTTQVKINGYTGWVRCGVLEIVPLVWVKSSSSYTISNESIRHNFTTKIQNTYSGSSGITIGPKPEKIAVGTYYSYDGHYFYNDRYKMVADYKAGNYDNSINKETPYYNYYQFLPQHTRTTYSSINIDEYVRNVMGYGRDVFGTSALVKDGVSSSRLYGQGTFFYNSQELYGANALLAFGVSRNETGNGKSNLAINKNNGFGLNAVDSNPTQASTYFSTFSQSILDYGYSWVNYGYSEPTDWRYFGSQNGNKYVGMNVKYASDVYWGEKMASNYYNLDKALGLQDYNFYQTAVTTKSTTAQSAPKTGKANYVYTYPSADNGLVILGEAEGEEVEGNKTWYKVVSDMNIDSNFKQLTTGYYNWDSYVYVPAAHVIKTNEGKNGYISPNEVTEYQDKNYTYDLHTKAGVLHPEVAISVKNTSYYYDPTLISKTGQTLLKDRYVMVFTTAYDENKNPVAYQVTSHYKYAQKHWVSADSIKFVTSKYGQANVTVSGTNTYTIVNPTTVDELSTHISGLYHYGYTPILEEKTVDEHLWYKVPVNLSGTDNVYGWTLASAPDVAINVYQYTASNTAPVITATDKTIIQGQEFNELEGVSATDAEDGNITESVKVKTSTLKINTPGTYEITYEVTDNDNETVTKTIKVTVLADEEPVINASDKTIIIGKTFDEMSGVTATDKEDGNLTKSIKVIKNTVNTDEIGTYEVTYQVTDSYNHTVEKTIKVTVTEIQLNKKNGEFYLESLNWNSTTEKYKISGYLIILNSDNSTKDAQYTLILKNKSSKAEYEININSWLNNVPYDLGSENGNNYSVSWFKDEFSLSGIPAGDYELYMRSVKGENYSEEKITNMFNKTIDRRAEDSVKGYNFKVQLSLASKQIELNIREGNLITSSTSNTFRNMINNYDDMKFNLNKLNIIGTSYNYGGTYAKESDITRTLILENTTTFKQYKYDIGAIKDGSYVVTSSDNLSKKYAWYNASIDVAPLPIGTYSMIVHTKTKDSEDYGEISDIFGMINKAETTINGKTYNVQLNKERMNRIELVVK